jgi:hypothetical protein
MQSVSGHNYKAKIALFAILLAMSIAILSGCIKKESLDPTQYITTRTGNMEVSAVEDYQNLNKCQVFYCLNSSGSVFSWTTRLATLGLSDVVSLHSELYSLIFLDPKPSLYRGNCSIEKVDPYTTEGQERLIKTLEGKTDEYVRSFMIGAGPNFAAADEAQRFCGGELGFATQWLGGSINEAPKGINEEDIKTVLKSNILPLLVYQIPADAGQYTTNISRNISELGPVLIAPGAFYSVGTRGTIDPSLHFQIVKQECPKCLTVALVEFNDFATIDHYADAVPGGFENNVDIIGYRINFNDFGCNKDDIALAISNFTQNISQTWKKPSMIVYMDFTENEDIGCTKDNITQAFDFIYAQIPIFTSQGLIGMGANNIAKFFDGDGILNIPGRAWFSNCESYYSLENPDEVRQVWLILPESGDTGFSPCNVLTASSISLLTKCDLNYSNSSIPIPIESNSSIGDRCFSDEELEADNIYELDRKLTTTVDGYEKYCALWSPAVRQFSSEFNFDPSVVMSNILFDNILSGSQQAMITGQECTHCSEYSGRMQEICCGTERLGYYYAEIDKTWDLTEIMGSSGAGDVCGGEPEWAKTYFAVYGYVYGRDRLNDFINAYIRCEQNNGCPNSETGVRECTFAFSEESDIRKRVSTSVTMREACQICKDKEVPDAPNWNTQVTPLNLIRPFKNSKCVVPFLTSAGPYWNNKIEIRDEDGTNIVRSVAEGKVVAVGEKPIRGKTVSVESAAEGITVTYSHLASIAVENGEIVSAKQRIGEVEDTLGIEMCSGSGTECLDITRGVDRSFLDPSQYLNIDCTNLS